MSDETEAKPDVESKKHGLLRLVVAFLGTGRGLEDKERLYFALGMITLALAALFGSILIVGAFLMMLRRL